MEDYAAKMLLKTDAALREYVTGHVQYREAAVLAALDELRRRGQPAAEEAALRPGLEAAAAEQASREAAAAAEAKRQQAVPAGPLGDEETGPALYSPVSIVMFSMFSVIIGAVLMCLNLYRLGKKRAMLGLVLFSIVYAFLGSRALTLATASGLSPVWGIMLFNLLAALAYVLWFWPRYVGRTSFRSRSVLVPLLMCLAILWGVQKITPYLMQNKEVREQMKDMMPK